MADTVAVVTNIPRPYRRALFGILDDQLAARGFTLRILYTSDPSKHARRGSSSAAVEGSQAESYVRSMTFRLGYERVAALPVGLPVELGHLRPSCVVVGGFSADAAVSACWCHQAKVPRILWSGAWPGKEALVGRLRSYTRSRLVRDAGAFIAYGTAAADYLTTLGAHPDQVFRGWNTVDLEGIASAAYGARKRRSELTCKYQLATRNLLFVGTLVETKGVNELLSAALAVESPEPRWALHFVGAGPLRAELEQTVRAARREANFRFHGLRPEADVAELLGVVDGLILPTKREAWGLVINEAMACGVPVVASPWAGATRDLIEDGVTGYVVEPADTAALARVMTLLLSGAPECREVGRAGAAAVRAKASLEKSAEGFVAAIQCALEGRRRGRS